MKKILATLAIAFGLTSCQAQTEFSKESLASKLTTTDNKDISFEEILKQNEGKTVVIEVWASWCSDCVKSMPQVKELKAQYPTIENFVLQPSILVNDSIQKNIWISNLKSKEKINSKERNQMKEWLKVRLNTDEIILNFEN